MRRSLSSTLPYRFHPNEETALPCYGDRQALLLPAAAERLVELHDREQLVAPRLRDAQLRVEQLAVCVERFEQVRDVAVVAQVREARAVAQGRDQQLALRANLPRLAAGDERVRHLAEGVLDSPLVVDEQKLPLRLREAHLGLDAAAREDGLRPLREESPDGPRRAEDAHERSALETEEARERDAREVSLLRNVYARARGDQLLLRGEYVGAALDQVRGQSGGHFGRRLLLGQTLAARDGARA